MTGLDGYRNMGAWAGRHGGAARLRPLLLGSVAGLLIHGLPAGAAEPAATALPTGGSVTAGQASIAQSGAQMQINQSSQRAVINWQSFNIGSQASVNFQQPNPQAAALNRVLAADPSVILGRLTANGQIVLISPGGVVFGEGAKVDVGGLVASVLDIKDADFLAGKLAFQRGNATGKVVNKGRLSAADGGLIALLAPEVRNDGVIEARLGTVALAAGDAVTLDLAGNGRVTLKVDPATVRTLVENRGMILATDGRALLSSQAANTLLGGAINDGGAIAADSLTSKGGEIVLDATGPVNLAGASLSARGATGGGTVTVGGWQTAAVHVDASSRLDASATGRGNGGTISVIGQDNGFHGMAAATGGPRGGNGGQVETSGTRLSLGGAVVDTSAAAGQAGTWLLDPADFTIAASGGDMTGAALGAALASNNVTILSSQGTVQPNGNGDVNVNDGVSWSSGNALTLSAYRNVNVNAAIGSSGGAAVTLRADNTGTGTGAVNFAGAGQVSTGGAVSIFYNPASYASPTDFSGNVGGGASLTAYMLVNDVDHLQAINSNLYGTYALGRSINAVQTVFWNNGAGFQPIGTGTAPFEGVFDGQGHQIFGLTINRPTESQVGLFGYENYDATIRNVGLAAGRITGNSYVGALVGFEWAATVANAWAAVPVSGQSYVGGLVGGNYGTVSDSHASGMVRGSSYVGGLTGFSGVIQHSYATGVVTGGDNAYAIGGLAGSTLEGQTIPWVSSISDSYATGAVRGGNGANAVGGLVGTNAAPITNSHASGSVTVGDNASRIGGLVGDNSVNSYIQVGAISGSEAIGTVTAGTAASDIGGLVGYNAGATISPGNVISDSRAGGRVSVGEGATAVGGLAGFNGGVVTGAQARGQVSAGDNATDVGGLLGDNTGSISDSQAKGGVSGGASSSGLGGLVGLNEHGTIANTSASGRVSAGDGARGLGGLAGGNTLSGSIAGSHASGDVHAGDNAFGLGGLVGYQAFASIADSDAAGRVSAGDNASDLGGLVGNQAFASILNSHASGRVSAGDGAHVMGGLLGGQDRGTVSLSYASGGVSADKNAAAVGGLVGANDRSVVDRSFARGSVRAGAQATLVGGLVGNNGGSIGNSYATGDVKVGKNSSAIGGLAGSSPGVVANAYSIGRVDAGPGSTAVGGLLGANSGTVTSSYWDVKTSHQTTSAGGAGLTTAQMKTQASYVGWDFVNTWRLDPGQYPELRGLGGQ